LLTNKEEFPLSERDFVVFVNDVCSRNRPSGIDAQIISGRITDLYNESRFSKYKLLLLNSKGLKRPEFVVKYDPESFNLSFSGE
jgi:hypothetical protein